MTDRDGTASKKIRARSFITIEQSTESNAFVKSKAELPLSVSFNCSLVGTMFNSYCSARDTSTGNGAKKSAVTLFQAL